jgi:hypothetical protein
MFSVVATILLGSENPIKLPIHGGSFDEKNPSCDSYSKCSGLHGDYDPSHDRRCTTNIDVTISGDDSSCANHALCSNLIGLVLSNKGRDLS